MKKTILLAVFAMFANTLAYAQPALKVYAVTGVKKGDALNMRAWPNPKSRVVVTLPYNSKWVASSTEPKKYGKSNWQRVHWNGESGWVNSKYLKYDAARTQKAQERRNHRLSRNKSGQKVAQKKTSAKTAPQVVMECGGTQPFWNVDMDLSGKMLKVNLRDGTSFNSPLYFRKWERGNNVMIVNSGKGRNAVRAKLTKTNACTDGITRIRYPFEVKATISGNRKVSGCCRSVQR